MTRLEYAERSGPRDSGWSLVGFALAAAAAAFAAWSWWNLWRGLQTGATQISIGVTPLYWLILCAIAATCVVGLRRGRRRFAVVGLVLLVATAAATFAIVRGSPWAAAPRNAPAAPPAAH